MTSKFLAVALTGMMAFGAVAAGPGPNGSNDFGLCTAYFNGQKEGHDNPNAGGNGNGNGRDGAPGPFQALIDESRAAADRADDGEENGSYEGSDEEAVYYYCMVQEGAPGVGGNPEHGRYECTAEESNGEEGIQPEEVECQDSESAQEKDENPNRGPKDRG